MKIDLAQITSQCLSGIACSKEQALELAINSNFDELLESASQIREKFFGNKVKLCMIINAKSGVCEMDCKFCSQSEHNSTDVSVYPFLKSDELAEKIMAVDGNEIHGCGVVTSGGRLTSDDVDTFSDTLKQTENKVECEMCASLGRLAVEDLVKLKESGLKRYHHNLETSENFYPQICSTQDWSERLETVKAAKAAGMEVCCGGLFGLGESWSDRIDLAETLGELDVDSVPINFLRPHPGTPMADTQLLEAEEALRIIAVFRHLLPTKILRVCGGRDCVLGDKQNKMFAAGANAIMTGDYLTTAGHVPASDKQMIESLGLEIQ